MADEIYAYTHPTDTAANWATGNRVLALGEVGYDSTNNQLRAGNGVDPWSMLPPVAGNAGGTVDQTARDLAQSALDAAAAKYAKPSSGIPQTDIDNVTSIKIDAGATAYQKPAGGVPDTDLASAFVKTVNGNQPDSNGNIVVSGGGSGGAVTSVAGKTGDVTLNKSDVGLANVSNTSDANKPVSTAQQAALDAKAAAARSILPGTGLTGGGDLTADRTLALNATTQASLAKADTALQTAPVTSVAGKAGDVTLNKSDVGLANADNTSDANKPVSTPQSAALAKKADGVNNVLRAGAGALGATSVETLPGVGNVVAVGQGAMAAVTAAKLSIAIGRNAMGNTVTTRDNIAIGDESLRNVNAGSPDYTQADLSGTRNIGVGSNAAYFLTSGYLNVAIGRNTDSCQVGGQGATAIGGNALGGFAPIGFSGAIENWAPWGTGTDRVYTTAVGSNAAQSNTAINNTAVGGDALQKNKKSGQNTAVGVQALANLDSGTGYAGGTYTVLNLSGTYSWSGTTLSITASGHGMSVGDTAFLQLTSGGGQTFQGDQAPAAVTAVSGTTFSVTTPSPLTANGNATVVARETAAQAAKNENNTAVGNRAGTSLLTGGLSTFVGDRPAELATSSSQATAIGSRAFGSATSLTNSTAVGFFAAGSMSADATQVTALGSSALRNRVDGNPMTDAFTNVTGVGYDSRVSGSNQLQLGNTATTVYAQSAIQTRSDARDKADVRDTVLGLGFIQSLRPVDFKWDRREDYTQYDEDGNGLGLAERDGSHKGSRYHHGFIAQDLQKTIADSGVDFGGFQDHSVNGGDDVLSVGYEEMIAPMVRAIQELSAQVQALKSEIDDLRGN